MPAVSGLPLRSMRINQRINFILTPKFLFFAPLYGDARVADRGGL